MAWIRLLLPLLSKLFPGAAYAVLALGLLAGSGYLGWQARGVVAERDTAAASQAHASALQVQESLAGERLAALQARLDAVLAGIALADEKARQEGDAIAGRLAAQLRAAEDTTRQLRKELRDAKARAEAAGRPVCDLSVEWVRLYDDALLRASGGGQNPPDSGLAPDSPGRAGDPGQRSSGLTEWGVADVHAENARRWHACRSQLNSLIDLHQGDAP